MADHMSSEHLIGCVGMRKRLGCHPAPYRNRPLDSADEIDLVLRRRRVAMQLEATAALREFAHAAE
jgi:hypothetical protein